MHTCPFGIIICTSGRWSAFSAQFCDLGACFLDMLSQISHLHHIKIKPCIQRNAGMATILVRSSSSVVARRKLDFFGAMSDFSYILRKGSCHFSSHSAKLVQTAIRRSTHRPKRAIQMPQPRAGPIMCQDNTPILDLEAKCRILAPFSAANAQSLDSCCKFSSIACTTIHFDITKID